MFTEKFMTLVNIQLEFFSRCNIKARGGFYIGWCVALSTPWNIESVGVSNSWKM